MSSEKQTAEEDVDTIRSNTTKIDEQDEETKSKTNESDIDDNDDTSSNASSEYEVEKILDKRKRRRGGGFEYYIKWVGYDDSANEWIPESSLSCPERVAEYERQEAKKRQEIKKEPSKRRSSLVHKQKHTRKRRRMKIIDNEDDDDDDNTEHVQTTKPSTSPLPPTEPIESSNSPSTQSDKDMNTHLSITYGVEKGYTVQAILGINRSQGDQLHYLVHYKAPTIFEDNMELIPSSIAKKYCEDEIIQFFETRIAWNERENN